MEIEKYIRDEILNYYAQNNISFSLLEYGNTHQLMIDYFEILRKRIPVKKWKVVVSRELRLKSKSPQFKPWLKRFKEIKNGFISGDDMNFFLSKRHKDSDFRDRLLTCWKMHHIHFFPEKKKGDMLLFVIVHEDTIYMIDAIPHNKRYVFSTYSLLNIVYDNWKFIYAPFEMKDVTSISPDICNDVDINKARKAGACTFIKIRDTVYFLDMMTSSGHGIHDVRLADDICNTININLKNSVFDGCNLEHVFLTGYHSPCLIILYTDKEGNIFPFVL